MALKRPVDAKQIKPIYTATEYKLSLINETFHQAELDSDQQVAQKDFLTTTLVSSTYETSQCEAQVPLCSSVVHSSLRGVRGVAEGQAAMQLHNLFF